MNTAGDTPRPEAVNATGQPAGPEVAEGPLVSPWKITAIGNRPHDHLVRDNLFGSLIRDHRGQAFQAMLRRPPDWMTDSVQHLPENQKRAALQVLGLNFLYQRTYARFVDSVAAHPDPPRIPGVLDAIQQAQRCWPVGALLEVGPGAQPTDAFVCKQAYLCPWCHGRSVSRLYRRLRPRFAEPIPFRWLVQIRFKLTIDDLPLESLQLWKHYMCTRNTTLFADASFPWLRVPIYYVHDEIKQQLRDKIARLGLKGGILTYQLGPDKGGDNFLGFSHRLGLLGEITFDSQLDQDVYFRLLEHIALKRELVHVCGWWRVAEFRALPTTYPQALRLLLAGSSLNYRLRWLQYKEQFPASDTSERGFLRDGLPGVLALQPLYLFDNTGLHDYVAAMTGIHLYDCFGSWRVSTTETTQPQPVQPPSLANLQSRQHLASRHRRLQTHNDQRQQEAADKRAALLETAKRVWPQVQQRAQQKQRGRPPYRQVLTQLLQQQGAQASDRDVRWLLRMLNPPATVTVDIVDTTATDTTDPAGT